MEKSAYIHIVGEQGCVHVNYDHFTHNSKRHRASKDIIIPADKGLHQRLLNLFKVKSFQKELSELLSNYLLTSDPT